MASRLVFGQLIIFRVLRWKKCSKGYSQVFWGQFARVCSLCLLARLVNERLQKQLEDLGDEHRRDLSKLADFIVHPHDLLDPRHGEFGLVSEGGGRERNRVRNGSEEERRTAEEEVPIFG